MRAFRSLIAAAVCAVVVPLAPAQDAPDVRTMAAQLDSLPLDRQVALLSRAMASGEFAKLSDDDVVSGLRALKPEAMLAWARLELTRLPEYEYWMTLQERLNGQWPARPAKLQVRYRHAPRQLQARWLPGGPHAGQQIIYDETQRKDEMYGRLGGVLGFAAMWVALDGSIARAQSNHTVRELGLQPILERFEQNAKTLRAAGRDERPTRIEVVQEMGQRMVAITWELPSGPPQYYAKRVQLVFDLKNPYPRVMASWNEQGEQMERMAFERLVARPFESRFVDLNASANAF